MSKSKIFMFDVDGTTPPRQKMTSKFENLFEKFVDQERVFLVSGSDIAKIRQQVPATVLSKVLVFLGVLETNTSDLRVIVIPILLILLSPSSQIWRNT